MKIMFDTEYEKYKFEKLLRDVLCQNAELSLIRALDANGFFGLLLLDVLKAFENSAVEEPGSAPMQETTALALQPPLHYNKERQSELLK
jgi:hypothetical protein